MAAKPVALPEIFTGDGKQSWSDWVDHFDSVAVVNGWEAADKKKWIRARITGRAATAYKRLSADDQSTYDKITAALKKRFEPECRKELFIAEFHQRKKRRTEDWAAFGEDLRTLVEKAYPTLQPEAQELLALNHLLSQIENPQLAFAVRQRAPTTVDAAVAAALELETYMGKPPTPIAQVLQSDDDVIAATGSSNGGGARRDMMQAVLKRLDKLEQRTGTRDIPTQSQRSGSRGQPGGSQRTGPNKRKLICWRCRREGHIARECTSKSKNQQGNEKPSEQ